MAHKRRKKVLKAAKGYYLDRRKKYRAAKQARLKAETFATRDRKARKRELRSLWILRINAVCREQGIKYSQFINLLKKSKIELDRKILADLAAREPKVLTAIIDKVKTK